MKKATNHFLFVPCCTILAIFIVFLFFYCLRHRTRTTQEIWGSFLVTEGIYRGERVYTKFDLIDLNTPDSLKCIRYKEAEKWIEKIRQIDKATCK